ncbi:Protein mab-21, partial [Trichinella zimbabwensis]
LQIKMIISKPVQRGSPDLNLVAEKAITVNQPSNGPAQCKKPARLIYANCPKAELVPPPPWQRIRPSTNRKFKKQQRHQLAAAFVNRQAVVSVSTCDYKNKRTKVEKMLGQPSLAVYQLNRFYQDRVAARKATTSKTLREICKIVQDVLKEVEVQEPRFISTLVEGGGRYEGAYVLSPTEFEIILYLNQMGVFNFVDDGSVPGCAVLKLSDGRKRSMSLWVEFITASGYLSARKIRSRFQALVAQAVEKSQYRDCIQMLQDSTEVRLRVNDRYVVQITTAFRCGNIWPRSASHWPLPVTTWPSLSLVHEVKQEGFDLHSKEVSTVQGKQSAMEGDAWVMSFNQAEDILLSMGSRRKCLTILKTLRDRHLDNGAAVTNYVVKTLVLYECEKHPHESEWDELAMGERIIGVLLQLVSCLQCRKCPHYFIPSLDLLQGASSVLLDQAAKQTWRLLRELITNPRALETL